MLAQRSKLFIDGDRALVALEQPVHDAMANNGFVRRADLQQLRRQAIQAGITVVANDQALVAVEHAQAMRHVFERGVDCLLYTSRCV